MRYKLYRIDGVGNSLQIGSSNSIEYIVNYLNKQGDYTSSTQHPEQEIETIDKKLIQEQLDKVSEPYKVRGICFFRNTKTNMVDLRLIDTLEYRNDKTIRTKFQLSKVCTGSIESSLGLFLVYNKETNRSVYFESLEDAEQYSGSKFKPELACFEISSNLKTFTSVNKEGTEFNLGDVDFMIHDLQVIKEFFESNL